MLQSFFYCNGILKCLSNDYEFCMYYFLSSIYAFLKILIQPIVLFINYNITQWVIKHIDLHSSGEAGFAGPTWKT